MNPATTTQPTHISRLTGVGDNYPHYLIMDTTTTNNPITVTRVSRLTGETYTYTYYPQQGVRNASHNNNN